MYGGVYYPFFSLALVDGCIAAADSLAVYGQSNASSISLSLRGMLRMICRY